MVKSFKYLSNLFWKVENPLLVIISWGKTLKKYIYIPKNKIKNYYYATEEYFLKHMQ